MRFMMEHMVASAERERAFFERRMIGGGSKAWDDEGMGLVLEG